MKKRSLKQNPLKATFSLSQKSQDVACFGYVLARKRLNFIRIVIVSLLMLYVSIFTDCSQTGSPRKIGDLPTVATNVNGLIVCDKSLLNETITIPLSFFIEGELQIVKLDDSDEALVKNNAAIISDNYILIQGEMPTPCKLFDKNTGTFISNIGSIGQGPNEYRAIYDQQIDELNNRIYLLPWNENKILVYDLKGKALEPIPLCHSVPKGGFNVDTKAETVTVATLPFGNAQAVVWKQSFNGTMLNYIHPEHLVLQPDFSNELIVYKEDDIFDFFIFSIASRADTLYRYDCTANKLIPLFTCHFEELKSFHFFAESSKFYFGDISEHKQVGPNMTSSQNRRTYFIDKQTLKGTYFILENDFLGGIEIEKPIFVLNGENFVYNADPGDLRDNLEKQLNSGKNLTPEMRKKLTKLKDSITDNDNNYIFYAKYKK